MSIMNEKMFQDKIISCKSFLDVQVISMTNILEKRLILNEIDKMVKANLNLQQNNLFWEWFFTNYVDGQIMEMMRILDQDQESKNIFRFIDSLLQGNQSDASFFIRLRDILVAKSDLPKDMVEQIIIPLFSATSLEADKKLLLEKSEEIKKYRDSVIAHSDPQKRAKINLTLSEINNVIDLVHEKILNYVLCFDGFGYPETGLLPTIVYDWKSIFRTPWLK